MSRKKISKRISFLRLVLHPFSEFRRCRRYGGGPAGIGNITLTGIFLLALFADFRNHSTPEGLGMNGSYLLIIGPLAGFLFAGTVTFSIRLWGRIRSIPEIYSPKNNLGGGINRSFFPIALAAVVYFCTGMLSNGSIFLPGQGGSAGIWISYGLMAALVAGGCWLGTVCLRSWAKLSPLHAALLLLSAWCLAGGLVFIIFVLVLGGPV